MSSIFCNASGQKVNFEKSRIYYSRNVNHNHCFELYDMTSFSLTSDLGKYLGIPLINNKVQKETFHHIVAKAQSWLCSGKTKSLSLPGRITLSQVVLSALPTYTYTMHTCILPRGIFYSLECIMRGFIWGSLDRSCIHQCLRLMYVDQNVMAG